MGRVVYIHGIQPNGASGDVSLDQVIIRIQRQYEREAEAPFPTLFEFDGNKRAGVFIQLMHAQISPEEMEEANGYYLVEAAVLQRLLQDLRAYRSLFAPDIFPPPRDFVPAAGMKAVLAEQLLFRDSMGAEGYAQSGYDYFAFFEMANLDREAELEGWAKVLVVDSY